MQLQAGDTAPDLAVKNQNDEWARLSDFRGQKIALYFYPQDNTPTCTVQACNLRDNHAVLEHKGYTVIGVSPDSVKRHQNFRDKFGLPFPLWADTEHELAKAFGVFRLKKFMGREFIGIHRTTFLINEAGIIERVIEKVKAQEHSAQITG